MSVAAAKKKYGSRLTISSLGAVLKEPGSEVVRIWHEGTNGVHTNNRIRGRDRTRCPRIEDLEALLREVEDAGGSDTHFVISLRHRQGSPPGPGPGKGLGAAGFPTDREARGVRRSYHVLVWHLRYRLCGILVGAGLRGDGAPATL